MDPWSAARDRFAPLITALRAELRAPLTYYFDVENTGGFVMCLFVRLIPAEPRQPGEPDRCVVFSEEWDEPDPTAESKPFLGRYYDWNDENDTDNLVYMEDGTRYESDPATMAKIAAWAAPIIREWLAA
jgi:hypothetical protein